MKTYYYDIIENDGTYTRYGWGTTDKLSKDEFPIIVRRTGSTTKVAYYCFASLKRAILELRMWAAQSKIVYQIIENGKVTKKVRLRLIEEVIEEDNAKKDS